MHKALRFLLIFAFVPLLIWCNHQKAMEVKEVKETAVTYDEFPYVDSATARSYALCSTRIDSADVVARSHELKAKKKLIAFDLDATITQHKTPITPEATLTLDSLSRHYDLVMVGGGGCERIYHQLNDFPIAILGNYGMEESAIVDGKFKIIRNESCAADTAFILSEAQKLREKYGYTEYWGESVEFHASGMLTFGLLGTKADKALKLVFDPDKKKRLAMYPEVMQVFGDKYAVYIGGTTSFDLVDMRFNKYDSTMRYAKKLGYSKDQVLFVGDDFTDGGNDSHVRLAGMDYIQMYDYRDFPGTMAPLWQ